jgi:type II secretory pathway pseudopilin PulG
MIELVIGIFIFGVVITGVMVSMSSALNVTRQNRNRSIAANLAAQEMDLVRSTKFTDLPLGEVLTTTTIDGVPYTIKRETGWVTAGATSGPCQTVSGNDPAYLSVDVGVSWNNMKGVKVPVSNTVVTPPVGTFDTNTGNIAVSVKNAAGLPQEGVAVSLTQTGESQTTTSDGCAFFAFEDAGNYTVSVFKAGYVSDQGLGTATQGASVQVGGTTSSQFLYDRAATLSPLVLTPTGGAPLPTSPGVPVSLGNTHIVPSGSLVVAGTGSSRTIGSLFPYTDGWETWAGACSDADPEGVKPIGGPYYVGASRTPPIAVTPGGTSSGTVSMPALTVRTQTILSVARPNVAVTATHVVPAGATVDPKCPGGEVYQLGSTDATGTRIVGLPWGRWTISAAGTSTTAVVVLNPNTTPSPVVIQW